MEEGKTPLRVGDMHPKLREHLQPTFIYVRNQFLASGDKADGRGAIFAYFNDDYDITELVYAHPEEAVEIVCDHPKTAERKKLIEAIYNCDPVKEFVIVMYLCAGIYTNGEYGQFISIVSKTGYGGIS